MKTLVPAVALVGALGASMDAWACAACSHGHAGHSAVTGGVPEPPAELRPNNARWRGDTASGFVGVRGDSITLTYSIAAEGAEIQLRDSAAGQNVTHTNIVQDFLDTNVGANTWLPLVQQAYGRWGEISGLNMVYESADDGAALNYLTNGPFGETGVRGDLRVFGYNFFDSGAFANGALAVNYFPRQGDMIINTFNVNAYSNPADDYRALRNIMMHEAGHGIGLRHTASDEVGILMNPTLVTTVDGPQHDDILSVQRQYGDAWEKNGGNDTTANATSLGTFTGETETFSIGTDADDNTTVVNRTETDFISIDGTTDTDVFSFSLTGGITFDLDIVLDPKGPTYTEITSNNFEISRNTKALTDLELELLDSNGTTILTSSIGPAGVSESIFTSLGAGDYFARVSTASGAADNVQLYRLDVTSTATVIPEPATITTLAIGGLLMMRRRRRV